MKRGLFILVGGLLLSGLLGSAVYYWQTSPERAMCCSDEPELAWLQHEFELNDEQFAQVRVLHSEYLSNCAAMCQRIAATNALIRDVMASHTNVTPELESLLSSAGQLRTQCQRQMLDHFYQISRAMPPEQGRRYLDWVQNQVFSMPHEQAPSTSQPSTHGH